MSEFNDHVVSDPFRPNNQLPYPAVKGQVLLTKSDFTYPARPDLMKWENIENVIGIEDVRLIFDEEHSTAELQKLVINEWTSVGVIGNVSAENAEKIKQFNFMSYVLNENKDTHKLRLLGKLPDQSELIVISEVNFVNYEDFIAKYTELKAESATQAGQIEELQGRVTTAEEHIDLINGHIESIDYKVQEVQSKVAEHTEEIENIKTRLTTDEDEIEAIKNTLTEHTEQLTQQAQTMASIIAEQEQQGGEMESLTARILSLENTNNNIVLPVVNKLREVENPFKVLTKGADGVSLEWKAMLGLDSVRLAVDNTRRVITLYQTINGIETAVGEWDKVCTHDLAEINAGLIPLLNNMNEHSEPYDILTKTSDGRHFSWKEAGFLIRAEKEIDEATGIVTITFKLIDEELVTFSIPNGDYYEEIITRLSALETKVAQVEESQEFQDLRLDTIEAEQTTQNNRLDTIEAEQIEQNRRLDEVEEWQANYKPIEALEYDIV